MKQLVAICAIIALPEIGTAQTTDIVQQHILPRFIDLADTTAQLAEVAGTDCVATSEQLRKAYHTAFDAWIAASHLRFGPTEIDDRAFALAFWPDTRGATPKALANLIADQDSIAEDANAYSNMSIAARGFYAMEFLLYDPLISSSGEEAYRCQVVQTVTDDIAQISADIQMEWQEEYASLLISPSDTGPYRTEAEALQQLFKALNTGLQFTSDTRLGRPLGSFSQPRPKRAETWRSSRSAHNVELSLKSLRGLAYLLSDMDPELLQAFDTALVQLDALEDPTFEGVAEPQARLKIEIIQQSIDTIRTISAQQLGPKLGVAAGFNSLDGD